MLKARIGKRSQPSTGLRYHARLGFAGLLIVSWGLAGCSKGEKEPEPTVEVQAAKVEVKPIQKIVEAQAVLFPLSQAAIVPKVTAPVRKFYVARGAKVRSGQLLAELENRDLSAATVETQGLYAQAQASYQTTVSASLPQELQKAEADLAEAKQTLDVEQKIYDSRQNLYQQGALPRKDAEHEAVVLVQAKNQYAAALKHRNDLQAVGKQQEIKSAEGQLTAAKGKNLETEAQLSYSEIRSPIDGVVTDRPLYPGEMPAGGVPLITVMDLSRVVARAHIPQEAAAALKLGDEASLEVPGVDDKVLAKVTMIGSALDPNSTTVEVWTEAKNPNQDLRPGTAVHVSIIAETQPKAMVVPAAALLTSPEGATTVMVIGSDGRAHPRTVKPGITQGKDLQIVEGLKAGEQVVVGGAYGLPDNSKVTIASDKPVAEGDAKGKDDKEKDPKDKE
jgi:HlyD family secretion protein